MSLCKRIQIGIQLGFFEAGLMKVLVRFVAHATVCAVCLWIAAFGGSAALPAQGPSFVTPSITVAPGNVVIIGTQQQFTATASGFGSNSTSVTWSVSAPSGSSLSPGDISSTGLYNTPYPAPPTVTVTATSVAMPTVKGSVTVTLSEAPTATGPALSVDAGNQTHAISPDIYGMNAFSMATTVGQAVNLPIDRWGGDGTSLYNYKLDVTSAGSDWYYQEQRAGRWDAGQQFLQYRR